MRRESDADQERAGKGLREARRLLQTIQRREAASAGFTGRELREMIKTLPKNPVFLELKRVAKTMPHVINSELDAVLAAIQNFSFLDSPNAQLIPVEAEVLNIIPFLADVAPNFKREKGRYLVQEALVTLVLLAMMFLIAACSAGPSSPGATFASTQIPPTTAAVATEQPKQPEDTEPEPTAKPTEGEKATGPSPVPEPSSAPAATPEVVASPTPEILPSGIGGLFNQEEISVLKELNKRISAAPADWGITPEMDLAPDRGNGLIYLIAINRADQQPTGRIIVLESITATAPLAIADLTDARALAQGMGLDVTSIAIGLIPPHDGQVVGVDADGKVIVVFDARSKQWHPATPPTPEPTDAPQPTVAPQPTDAPKPTVAPETAPTEIAKIQQAIETWVAGKYDVIGIRVSWDGKNTPRVLNLIQHPGEVIDANEYSDKKPITVAKAQGVIIGHTLTPNKDAVVVYVGFSSGFGKPEDKNFVLPFKIGPMERSAGFNETDSNSAGLAPKAGIVPTISDWDGILRKLSGHAVDISITLGWPDDPEDSVTDRERYFLALFDEAGAVVDYLNQQLPPELQGKYIFKTPPRENYVNLVRDSANPPIDELAPVSMIAIGKLPN